MSSTDQGVSNDLGVVTLPGFGSTDLAPGDHISALMPLSIGDSGGGSGPSITVISPTPGVPPGSPGGFPGNFTAAATTPIVVQVEDATLIYVCIVATFLDGTQDVVFRRGNFAARYLEGSFYTVVGDVTTLTCVRADGWPFGSDTIGDIAFDIDAIDRAGILS